MEGDWQGLWVEALMGPVGQVALEGGVLGFLEETKVGCRSSRTAKLGPVGKEGGASEGEEGGPGFLCDLSFVTSGRM